MLRYGCGYALANAGHDTRAIQAWMRHKNIQHTVRYTELAPVMGRVGRSAYWLDHDPSGLVEAGFGPTTK
jgi:integrase